MYKANTDISFFQKTCNILEKIQYVNYSGLLPAVVLYHSTERGQNIIDPSWTVLKLLKNCDTETYYTTCFLLQISASIPLILVSVKCTFSTLGRLKTWHRSNTFEEWLTGLALKDTHRK